MGRYDFKPLRVHQRTQQLLESRRLSKPPCWYEVVRTITPAQTLIRPQPIQHPLVQSRLVQGPDDAVPRLIETHVPRRKTKLKKASRIFQPVDITYEEDQLRQEFFKHHPWELARPRILLENDGKDYLKNDWSRLKQRHRSLDGESVIQRQLWLLHNIPNITKADAYDRARKEFYQLRLKEDITRRIAKEEAEATGAYWGKSMIEVGEMLEDKEYNRWLEWAETEATRRSAGRLASVEEGVGALEAEENSPEMGEEQMEREDFPISK